MDHHIISEKRDEYFDEIIANCEKCDNSENCENCKICNEEWFFKLIKCLLDHEASIDHYKFRLQNCEEGSESFKKYSGKIEGLQDLKIICEKQLDKL